MRSPLRPVAALLACLALGGCERENLSSADRAPEAPAEPSVEVSVTPVRRGPIDQRISAPGSLVARRESRIGTEVKGRIQEIFADEGERVEAGDPLFRIDPEFYELAAGQAEAGLALARAERHQIQADLERGTALRGSNVVSQQELERLRTQLEVGDARLRQADRQLALARRDLDRTLVRAPYAGSIAERLEDEGTTALVQPQTIVLVLQETVELEARVPIPESQLTDVSIGDPALLHVEGLSEPIHSQVSAVSDTIDPATRTYLVSMRVPNPDHRFKAGTFAHVEIQPAARPDVLFVPREAIRREEGRTRVLVVREGRATAVPVRLGLVSEDAAEVLAGVAEGDRVIVGAAARRIAPGMRVQVEGEPRAAAP